MKASRSVAEPEPVVARQLAGGIPCEYMVLRCPGRVLHQKAEGVGTVRLSTDFEIAGVVVSSAEPM